MKTKRRPVPRTAKAVFVAILAVGVLSTLASTRSLAPRISGGALQAPLVYPERENEQAGVAQPNEVRDLQLSSGQDVSAAQVRRMQAQAAEIAPAASGIKWQQLGPFNIGGRVTDVVADPTTPNAAWAALAGGGIWSTSDGGANWTNTWPDHFTQPIGAMARGKDGTLWVGTGEQNPPGGGLTYFGDGVYKSTDNGATWTNIGLRQSEAIGRIAVDPTNPQRVFVAAVGHVARSSPERGLYRTDDGGKTWELVLEPTTASTGAIDVAINPQNPSIIYAAMWDRRRTNGTRIYGGVGSGLFRSKDGGETWERLENIVHELPSYDQTGTGLTSHPSLGRIGVAIAPSDPNRIYVVFGNQTGPDKGFYVSNDGGDTFACPRTAAGACSRAYRTSSGFQWWFGRPWVDPENPDIIYNADVELRRSTNGGSSFTAIAGIVHADQHGLDWDPSTVDGDPATPSRLFLGNDGGMYRSENNGAAGSWIPATNQPWMQIYSLSVSQQDSRRMVIGTQDNGSLRSWTSRTTREPSDPALRDWVSHGGGDGHWNVIDPVDDRWYYACSQSSGGGTHSCRRYNDPSGTGNNGTALAQLPAAQVPGQRYTTHAPLIIDPNIPPLADDGSQPPAAIYVGGATIGRSLNRGTSFTPISPIKPASVPNEQDPRLPGPVPVEEMDSGLYANLYGAVTHLAPAKSRTPVPYAQTIYAGTDTGLVWKTSDAGQNWTRMQGLPERWVNYIIADPDDEDHAYVAFSGFRQGDDAANIWETRDGGATWNNISFNLPNGPVEAIEYDHRTDVLYAATDVGVFNHKDGDPNWYKISVGMPQVPVLDVKLSADGKEVFAATFGRSVFKLNLTTDAVDGGGVGEAAGTVPATLALGLGGPATFGAFTPGVENDYTASTTANVISTAGDATLSVADASSNATGHLVNGAFSLPSALQVKATSPAAGAGAFGPIGGSAAPSTLLTYTGPVSNDPVTLDFTQHIGANDALRTGSYSKTLTFTLSTANP